MVSRGLIPSQPSSRSIRSSREITNRSAASICLGSSFRRKSRMLSLCGGVGIGGGHSGGLGGSGGGGGGGGDGAGCGCGLGGGLLPESGTVLRR